MAEDLLPGEQIVDTRSSNLLPGEQITTPDIIGGLGKTDLRSNSLLGQTARDIAGGASDFIQGIGAAGVIRPAINSIDFVRKLLGYDPLANRPAVKAAMTSPDSSPGKAGDIGGTALDFLLPEVYGIGKVRTAITAGKGASLPAKVASVIGRGGLEAGTNAGITAAQTGDPHAAMTAALVSGALGSLGAAAEQPLINRATKMEAAAIKPPLSVIKSVKAVPGEGAKELASNVFKYDLGGSLKDTEAKTISAIRSRAQQLHDLLQGQPVTYNLHDAIDQTEQELLGSMEARAKNATFLPEVKSAIAKFRNDADKIAPEISTTIEVPRTTGPQGQPLPTGVFTQPQKVVIRPAGQADLLSANDFKRSVGHETSFDYGGRSRDAQGVQIVANSLYSKLRQGIETAAGNAGPEIKRINRELGDLIPIERAVVRRVPIGYRQNMISLGTLLSGLPALATGDLRELALPAAYYASKSPRVANLIQKGATIAPGLSGKIVSGMIAEGQL